MNPFNPDRAVEVEEPEGASEDADPVVPYLLAKIETLNKKLKATKEEQGRHLSEATERFTAKVDALQETLRGSLGEVHQELRGRVEKLDASNVALEKALKQRLEAISDGQFKLEQLARDLRPKAPELSLNGTSKPASNQPTEMQAVLAELRRIQGAPVAQNAPAAAAKPKKWKFSVVRDDYARIKDVVATQED